MSTVYRSDEPCWRCGGPLVRLEPPLEGWPYYCPRCEQLTITAAQCDALWRSIGGGAIGAVVAVTRRLRVVPEGSPDPIVRPVRSRRTRAPHKEETR
jgi:hypothetical protein